MDDKWQENGFYPFKLTPVHECFNVRGHNSTKGNNWLPVTFLCAVLPKVYIYKVESLKTIITTPGMQYHWCVIGPETYSFAMNV